MEAVIERIAVLSDKDKVYIDDLPTELTGRHFLSNTLIPDIPDEGIIFEEWERKILVRAMEKANGNMTTAAKLLGMSYRTYRYRLNCFGLIEK